MSLVDGKVAKLRASCDGCNESKLRCSQTKPRCARCTRQGVPCVYGLSRRSHRTAPRVGETQAAFATPSPGSASSPGPSRDQVSASVSPAVITSNRNFGGSGALLPGVTAAFQNDDNSAEKYLFNSTDILAGFDKDTRQLGDWSAFDAFTEHDSTFNPLDDLSRATNEAFGLFSNSHTTYSPASGKKRGDSLNTELQDDAKVSPTGPCKCSEHVAKQLSSLPLATEEKSRGWDAQFSQLKRAISVSDKCLNCICVSQDEMSISK